MTSRQKAANQLESLLDQGVSHRSILEYLIFDWMEGNQAYQALSDAEQEFFPDYDEDEDEDEDEED